MQVSNMGRVKLQNGRRTRGSIKDGRRHIVRFQVSGQRMWTSVHVLMACTFLGNRPSYKHTVDHIDGNSLNNMLANLRWATKEEQARNRTCNTAVTQYDLEGKVLQTYETIAEVVQDSGLTRGCMRYAAQTGGKGTGFIRKFTRTCS